MKVLNASTGPVELTAATLRAMAGAGSTSHAPDAQAVIIDTQQAVHAVLGLPEDFLVAFLPGSIRQALQSVVDALSGPGSRVAAVVSGYWGGLIADLAERASGDVTRMHPSDYLRHDAQIFTAVHVETEYGTVLPLSKTLAAARAIGAVTVVDAACSVPIDHLPYDDVDILILGSHKCLGGPAGLGIVALRERLLGSPWLARDHMLNAYVLDAAHKRQSASGITNSPSPNPPLVTYPMQVVAGLRAAVLERTGRGVDSSAHARAAKWLREQASDAGYSPYGATDATMSNAVVRLDVPPEVSVDALRADARRQGVFVIGNVGASVGGSIRVGTMSLAQIDEGALRRVVDALAFALLRQSLRH